jgi:hypothetical protein
MKKLGPIEQTIARVPTDPAEFTRYRASIAGMTADEYYKNIVLPHTLDTGGALTNIDPVTGKATGVAAPKTPTPGELLTDKRLREGLGGYAANLPPEEQAALNKAVGEGRINPYRINGRNALTLARALIANPNADLNTLAGNASLLSNAQFQQRAATAGTIIPTIQSMVEAGKKLNYSDTAFVGKVQQWLQGQLNDPDLASYMAQRNDSMLMIASVARGVGMSDLATKMENEVQRPSMSPKALQGYLDGQVKILEPRVKFYARHFLETPTSARETGATAGTSKIPAKLTDEDQKAIEWANANPNDPRAAQIQARLGAQ